jgi:hypothetical protein
VNHVEENLLQGVIQKKIVHQTANASGDDLNLPTSRA